MQVILANPRGFCAGVDRAIEIVERALEIFGAPIYVRDELDQVPDDATVIFSAHGVPRAVQEEAQHRGLKVFDATCPLVTKVHLEIARYSKAGQECILIGHAGHPEVEGTMGQFDDSHGGHMYLVETVEDVASLEVHNPDNLAYVTQTTLSMDDTSAIIDALRQRFPKVHGPKRDDICYATQNRQDAVKSLADASDMVLVVGSINSSNSNRLKEVAERRNTPAYLIDNADEIKAEWLQGKQRIGVTAGASAPEVLVEQVISRLKEWGAETVNESQGRRESITFTLPKELKTH
jgi:4-hydroxy-3-methylbut-2-enyl diphosphate reductase